MRLGMRAKLTIGVGVAAAAGFLALGLRELGAPPKAQVARTVGLPRDPAPAQMLLAGAARAIRTGETITADMVRSLAADAVRHPMAAAPVEVIGRVAAMDIAADALIARTALAQEANLAIRVPVGMRAISLDTTAEIAVAGLLRPGDRVDVQVVYPGADAISGARGAGRSQAQTLLQMVQVLAVGDAVVGTPSPAPASGLSGEADDGRSRSSAPAPAVARTVTLALYPDQVAALSLAKSTGALHLSLRNPNDSDQPQIARAISSGPLPTEQRALAVAPPPAPPAASPRPARAAGGSRSPSRAPAIPQPPHAIDLVVGGSRAVIYSGGETR
jgi:pilus assembly protein CpaB